MADLAVELCEKGLYIVPASGRGDQTRSRYYFNYLWLRDNCSTSWSAETRDRVFDILSQPVDIKPSSVEIRQETLIIRWDLDGHVSCYNLGWLLRWQTHPGHPDPADIRRNVWDCGHLQAIGRFAFAELTADLRLRQTYLEVLLRDGIAIVQEMPDTDAALTDLAEIGGRVRATFSGSYFTVRAKPDPVGIAYTAHALEPHTDSPCEDFPPGIQYLHCRLNSTIGGESIFMDGAAVAEELRRSHPRDFELLANTTIPFRFAHRGLDMRARQRVIETDERGVVTGVTFSQHMADVFDLEQTLLDQYYPAFHRFATLLRDDRFVIKFLMKAGECIVFDNHRIVHGRLSYDSRTGSRMLRGCYTDRGELRSRYRVISREHEPADRPSLTV